MNEQDMRVIYEWLYEDLKGKAWDLHQTFFGVEALPANAEELGYLPYIPIRKLPPLDMNTWDREALPKLDRDEVTASFYGGLWHLDANMFANADPWLALLDYIKAVQP